MASLLFDTHTHYYDCKFNQYPGGRDQAVKDSIAQGVDCFVQCSTRYSNALECLEMARLYSSFYSALGLHPEDSFEITNTQIEIDAIVKLLKEPKVVAIGEIGLDYHYPEYTNKQKQKDIFDNQLSIAESLHLPVVIHARDAQGDTFDILSSHPNVHGVLHCYSGSSEMARQYANKGWYFSFGGTLTYPKAEKVISSFLSIPKEQIMLETDCPYLPPSPHRGEINYSGFLPYICQKMADLWQISYDEAATVTTQNAHSFFNIKK